jgi:shikimate kinase
MKKNLIFIGMPAVGKSTVGIVVANAVYRYRSVDPGAGEETFV